MLIHTDSQRRVFDFLKERCATQEPFMVSEFQAASGFSHSSFKTYFSKQFKSLLVPCGGSNFRVHLGFRRFSSWQRFREEVVTQNRKLVRNYRAVCHTNVLSYEFFMPLRNEEWLRAALDSLFFKDAVVARLKAMNGSDLTGKFPKNDETQDAYLGRICSWVSDTFGGYSISHVSGRFKAGSLRTRREVADAEVAGACRYLVDETTAIVRFIFPCGCEGSPTDAARQADQIWWFFEKLFVQSILEVVNGEDEIWLLESGMRNQLRVFRAED